MQNAIVVFGGTGFIGTHLAQFFLQQDEQCRVYLVDIKPPQLSPYTSLLENALKNGRARYIEHDVRKPILADLIPEAASLTVNLAAVHREPGHTSAEYFETNLMGAENVCAYAASVGCRHMVFTSSISPYGPTEDLKTESSLPVPETAYGSSKLAAEKIHQGWMNADSTRSLIILRPGVVFGPGEGGNVTRLVRSVVRGYFVYTGNRATRKAGGYVKELCRVIQFALDRQAKTGERFTLLNFSIDPTPSIEQYVDTIRKVAEVRRSPLSLPRSLLMGVSYPIHGVASALRIKQPINPVRMRKLFRSTSIDPAGLRSLGYRWTYSMEEAFRDWKADLPEDFR